MKKIIEQGGTIFTIIVSKTTITHDAYNKSTDKNHTWTVKAFEGTVLLYTDKTRVEGNVITLVKSAHDYIDRGALKPEEQEKTLEQKLSEMGFN